MHDVTHYLSRPLMSVDVHHWESGEEKPNHAMVGGVTRLHCVGICPDHTQGQGDLLWVPSTRALREDEVNHVMTIIIPVQVLDKVVVIGTQMSKFLVAKIYM